MTCSHCGGPLEEGSLFCGTCGRSTTAPARRAVLASDVPPLVEPPVTPRVAAPLADARREPVRPVPEAPSAPAPASPVPEASVPEATIPEPLLPVPDLPPVGDDTASDLPVSDQAASDHAALIDLESTVVTGPSTPRFVLQFSTGESVTVRGEGLIGRGPVREPGEAVDQLIALADAGRSVSKTHVGFGQDRGRFWVSDRYSTNGTVVRPPDAPARRCEPGRRYLVSRGTRVDIGDQFFVVS